MSANVERIEDEILPLAIRKEMLRTGLLIVGGKGKGKSTAGKVITSNLINSGLNIQCKVFDTACNWRWAFEPILFQEIETGTRYIYGGKDHILYDIEMVDEDEVLSFIQRLVMNDWEKQREAKKVTFGKLDNWILYTLEEAQSSISRFSLQRKGGRGMLKMISEGRNMNQSFIIIGQRLANISPSLVERCHGMLFSKMVGDNDLAKIRRKCGKDSGIDKEVKKLNIGEFLYWNGESAYIFNCPDYQVSTRPKEWKMRTDQQKVWQHFYGRRIL